MDRVNIFCEDGKIKIVHIFPISERLVPSFYFEMCTLAGIFWPPGPSADSGTGSSTLARSRTSFTNTRSTIS
jgi:hypothetical protein